MNGRKRGGRTEERGVAEWKGRMEERGVSEWKREGCQNGRERNARTEEELTPLVRPARVLRKHFQRKRIININKY